ncbi:MAG TPA: hypothetical protein VI893_07545, partial [Thermoplasmata archaeon]|nr:hypothetical protein [Thermoplasmata archaeon]
GSEGIWIRSMATGRAYAAPYLVVRHIEIHGNTPPTEFLDAVRSSVPLDQVEVNGMAQAPGLAVATGGAPAPTGAVTGVRSRSRGRMSHA